MIFKFSCKEDLEEHVFDEKAQAEFMFPNMDLVF